MRLLLRPSLICFITKQKASNIYTTKEEMRLVTVTKTRNYEKLFLSQFPTDGEVKFLFIHSSDVREIKAVII